MLQIRNLFKAAFKSLMKNGTRSLLTSLGIIIGVSAVIVMVAIGEGAQTVIEEGINSLGTNLIIVFPGVSQSGGVSRGAGSFNRFTFDDVEKIRKEATLLRAVSPVVRSGGQIIGGVGNWFTTVYGVSPEYFEIRNWEIEKGAFFTERDDRSSKKVALLGATVAKQLFPDEDPTGRQIRIRNTPFTIIGVLKAKGQSGMGTDQDDIILAPSTTVLYRLRGGRWVDMLNASAMSAATNKRAQEELRTILREAHRLNEGDDDDFTIRDQAEIAETASETSRVMTLLLGSIAAVSLIVGGIGIMNIMLVSVTERTREIGIRMAVGAKGKDILIQFLVESIVLSLIGGIVGIMLGTLSSKLISAIFHWPIFTSVSAIALSFFFAGFVGVFFGFYPARKASLLDPIEALRYE